METRHLIAYALLALMAVGFAIALYHMLGRTWLRRIGRRRRARERVAEDPPAT